MRKKINVFICVLVVGFMLVSCASTSIIEHQGMAFGVEQPEWLKYIVGGETSKIKNIYPGQQPIVYSAIGSNKELLKRKGNTTGVNAEVARMASTAVVQNANDMAVATGEEFDVQAYSDAVQQSSMTSFKGLKKEGEWWVLVKNTSGKEEYRYFFLYLMDIELFNEQISTLVKDTAKELNNTNLEDAVERNADAAEGLYDRIQDRENQI